MKDEQVDSLSVTLSGKIFELVQKNPGMTDREIADILRGKDSAQQPINQVARNLESRGVLKRTPRHDGKIGNYPTGVDIEISNRSAKKKDENADPLSEDRLKEYLRIWLEDDGWKTCVMWGRAKGVDIEADKGKEKWIIEVKGIGSLNAMRVNYFLAILGETLQRMADSKAKYSIALPDVQQYRNLWARLPALAKERTRITMLFVDSKGAVREEN